MKTNLNDLEKKLTELQNRLLKIKKRIYIKTKKLDEVVQKIKERDIEKEDMCQFTVQQ